MKPLDSNLVKKTKSGHVCSWWRISCWDYCIVASWLVAIDNLSYESSRSVSNTSRRTRPVVDSFFFFQMMCFFLQLEMNSITVKHHLCWQQMSVADLTNAILVLCGNISLRQIKLSMEYTVKFLASERLRSQFTASTRQLGTSHWN